jgi:predicted DNA-binding transcriptional regulator AlpA
MHRILSLKEVALRVPYSEKHLRRLSKAGLFPPILRVGPHRVGILEKAVEEWIATRRQVNQTQPRVIAR